MKKNFLLLICTALILSACTNTKSTSEGSPSEKVDSSSTISSSETISPEPISSTISPEPISSSSSQSSETITVSKALEIAKSLGNGITSNEKYKITGLVSNGFDPKETSQTKGTYNFDIVDTQGEEALIVWYLGGPRLPIKGEAVTLDCRLQHYVDKNDKHIYQAVDGTFTLSSTPTPSSSSTPTPSSSSKPEPISSSTPEPISSSSLPSQTITVSKALSIVKALGDNVISSESYTISGFVSNGFDPKESTQTKGTYNFDIVDTQGGEALIAWYLSGPRMPVKGEPITLECKLQHYVDKNSKHKYEGVNGSFSVGGTPTPSSSSTPEPISSSSYDGSSSTIPTPIDDPEWKGLNFNTYGSTFRNKLASLITGKVYKTASYSQCLSIGAKAAAYPNKGSSTFIPFYHEAKDSEKTTTNSCNREHTWPNARKGSKFENDPFMVRPTLTGDNTSRGNAYYGLKEDNNNYWDPACCGYEGARGEAARIILYCATKYYDIVEGLDNRAPNPNEPAATAKAMMGKLQYLMQWNRKYPVSAMEKQINDYLDDQGYGRNPFVDHPEYAEYIWDENGLRGNAPTPISSYSGGTSSSSMPDTRKEHQLTKSLDNLGSFSVCLVSASSTTSGYGAITSKAKSDTLPWYILSTEVDVYNDMTIMRSYNESDIAFFSVTKESNKYKFVNVATGKTLYNYVDGTHFSIGYDVKDGISKSEYWNIEASGDGFYLKGDNGVYFTLSSQGTFAGNKTKPNVPTYFYI